MKRKVYFPYLIILLFTIIAILPYSVESHDPSKKDISQAINAWAIMKADDFQANPTRTWQIGTAYNCDGLCDRYSKLQGYGYGSTKVNAVESLLKIYDFSFEGENGVIIPKDGIMDFIIVNLPELSIKSCEEIGTGCYVNIFDLRSNTKYYIENYGFSFDEIYLDIIRIGKISSNTSWSSGFLFQQTGSGLGRAVMRISTENCRKCAVMLDKYCTTNEAEGKSLKELDKAKFIKQNCNKFIETIFAYPKRAK